MAIPIEQLYRLSARDEQLSWLQPVILGQLQGAASTAVGAGWTIPKSALVVAKKIFVRAIPAAGQRALLVQALLSPPEPSTAFVLLGSKDVSNIPTVALQHDLTVELGDMYISENWRITGQVLYDAGVGFNQLNVSFTGVQIPNGNVDRV